MTVSYNAIDFKQIRGEAILNLNLTPVALPELPSCPNIWATEISMRTLALLTLLGGTLYAQPADVQPKEPQKEGRPRDGSTCEGDSRG